MVHKLLDKAIPKFNQKVKVEFLLFDKIALTLR